MGEAGKSPKKEGSFPSPLPSSFPLTGGKGIPKKWPLLPASSLPFQLLIKPSLPVSLVAHAAIQVLGSAQQEADPLLPPHVFSSLSCRINFLLVMAV